MTAKPSEDPDSDEPRPYLCSGLNCVIAQDVKEIKQDVRLLVLAVQGEPRAGAKGLIEKTEEHGADIAALKNDRNRVVAWVVAGVVLIGALWEIAKTVFRR
jgi:hypothetical protein